MNINGDGSGMIETNLPPEIRAIADRPLDAAALETLRARYLPGPLTAQEADELLALGALIGEQATPAFRGFLEEALAGFLVADFQPLGRS